MSVKFINYQDKEILLVSYNGLTEKGGTHLELFDMTNSFATPGYMKVAKKVAGRSRHQMKKGAIIGITAGKKVLLKGFNLIMGEKSLKPFDTIDEAKEYLVSE